MQDEDLPADIDPALWFTSRAEACAGGRDFLVPGSWFHTFPGRMAAYCPHDPTWPGYRISLYEMPADLPDATRHWIGGFLAGNVPQNRVWDEAEHPRQYAAYVAEAERFLAGGGKWDDTVLYPRPRKAPPRRAIKALKRGVAPWMPSGGDVYRFTGAKWRRVKELPVLDEHGYLLGSPCVDRGHSGVEAPRYRFVCRRCGLMEP